MSGFIDRSFWGLVVGYSLLLTGCGSSSPMTKANFDKIQTGMTVAEVSAVMGFKPPNTDETSIIGGVVRDTANEVEREHKPENLDGIAYDEFHYKELGGTNKKAIYIEYNNGKLVRKEETGLQ